MFLADVCIRLAVNKVTMVEYAFSIDSIADQCIIQLRTVLDEPLAPANRFLLHPDGAIEFAGKRKRKGYDLRTMQIKDNFILLTALFTETNGLQGYAVSFVQVA